MRESMLPVPVLSASVHNEGCRLGRRAFASSIVVKGNVEAWKRGPFDSSAGDHRSKSLAGQDERLRGRHNSKRDGVEECCNAENTFPSSFAFETFIGLISTGVHRSNDCCFLGSDNLDGDAVLE